MLCVTLSSIQAKYLNAYIIDIYFRLIGDFFHILTHFSNIFETQRGKNFLKITAVSFFKEINVHFTG